MAGNVQQTQGTIGEDSGIHPNKSNRNFNASKNMTSAVKPLIHYSFARGKPRKTPHKPVGCAGPVKPNPAADECRQLPQSDSIKQHNPLEGQFASVLRKDEQTINEGMVATSRAPDKLNNNSPELQEECEHVLESSGDDEDIGQYCESDSGEAKPIDSDCGSNKLLRYSYREEEEKAAATAAAATARVAGETEDDDPKEVDSVAYDADDDKDSDAVDEEEEGETDSDEQEVDGKEYDGDDENDNDTGDKDDADDDDHIDDSEDDCSHVYYTACEDDNDDADDHATVESRQLRKMPQSDSKSIDSQGCAGPAEPNSRASECQRQSQISQPDSTSSHSDKPPFDTKEAHFVMGQTCTSDKRSYADVLTGAHSKPTHVHRPISSDSFDAAFGYIGQEMGYGTQRQQSDTSQDQQPAKTNMQLFLDSPPSLHWPPLVNNHIDNNNTDFESWHGGEHSGQHGGGHSPLDSENEGYDDNLDHMASDTDNDPWGPRIRSLGRLIPEAYFDWPFGYCITQLLFMESVGPNYLDTAAGFGTTNVDTRPVQQDHLLQMPDTTIMVPLINTNQPSPQQHGQHDDQMEAPEPTSINPEVCGSQVQTATTSSDSLRVRSSVARGAQPSSQTDHPAAETQITLCSFNGRILLFFCFLIFVCVLSISIYIV